MRIFKILLIVLVLVLIVAALVLWRLPADVAYRYGSKYLGPVALSGLSGSLWDGHADGISVFGRDLGDLEWHARKSSLLRGRFVADVRIGGADVGAAGVVTRDSTGAVDVHELRFSVPASMLAPTLDLGGLQLLGTISGVLHSAHFAAMKLSDVQGDARWSQAGVTGPAEAHFSDMLAEFSSQPDGGIGGRVHDDGSGNLVVDGRFRVDFGTFDAEATLRARNDDPAVAEMLRHVGTMQADGSTHLGVHGQTLKAL